MSTRGFSRPCTLSVTRLGKSSLTNRQQTEVVEILDENEILPKDRSGGGVAAGMGHRFGWEMGGDLSNKHRPHSLPVPLR